jgi:hypothetical protein
MQGLRAVEHEQVAPLLLQPARHQSLPSSAVHTVAFSVAPCHSQQVFQAVFCHARRHDQRLALELDAVDQQPDRPRAAIFSTPSRAARK